MSAPRNHIVRRVLGRRTIVPVLLATALLAAAGCAAGPGRPGPPGTASSTIWAVLGLLLILGVVAAIAYAVVLLVRKKGAQPIAAQDSIRSVEQILEERLARGEIDVAEFTDRLAALRQFRA